MPNLIRPAVDDRSSLTMAEHARTILATATGVELAHGRWTQDIARFAIDIDGSILMPESDLWGGPSALGAGDPAPTASFTAFDVCSVPQPDRVRGGVVLRGPLHRVSTRLPEGVGEYLTELDGGEGEIVRLFPTSVSVQWRCEGGHDWQALPVEDYTCARLDPLVGWEVSWISHLHRDHEEVLRALAIALDPTVSGLAAGPLRPLLADRYGLVLRHYGATGTRDLRIPFVTDIECGCDAVEALNALVAALP